MLSSDQQLQHTPSNQDGIPMQLEIKLRLLGTELIRSAGILLKLPQVAVATGQVLLNRFYHKESLKNYGVLKIAMGAIFLAAKLEEQPRRVRDVVNVFDYLRKAQDGVDTDPMEYYSQDFYDAKDNVTHGEIMILRSIGFKVHVTHPHGLMMCCFNFLNVTGNHDFCDTAWRFLNDSFQTPVHVWFLPHTIAGAVLYLTNTQFPDVNLATTPPWWEAFVDFDAILRLPGTTAELSAHLARLQSSHGVSTTIN